jgi:putative endonuclease
MNTKAKIGFEGEKAAADYLVSKGFKILCRNFRHRRSEIDIICTNEQFLVFVEVKTKSYTAFGEPEVAVDDKKAAKIMEGAEHYIQETDWKGDVRFDVIALVKSKGEFTIEHFEDAFY